MWPSRGGRGICGTRGGERRLEVLWHVVSNGLHGALEISVDGTNTRLVLVVGNRP